MIGLLQRVDGASVEVDGATIARIGAGLLVLVGVERGDDEDDRRPPARAPRELPRVRRHRRAG